MAEQVPNVIGSLQNKLNSQSFNPNEYSNEQLQVIDGLLEQGVLKGPRMGEIVRTFSETQRTIAKEKRICKRSISSCIKR
jgi:hypothetical protein